jgi:hypothetical protein
MTRCGALLGAFNGAESTFFACDLCGNYGGDRRVAFGRSRLNKPKRQAAYPGVDIVFAPAE